MPDTSPNPRLIERLVATGKAAAIGVGGSRAAGTATDGSDFDLYVLTTGAVVHAVRQDIAREIADPGPVEIGNHWWGDEDGYAIDGVWYEIAYFGVDWFFDGIDAVLHQHRASQGYSTSFVYTLSHMQPVYDPNGLIASQQANIGEYPPALASAIIEHNLPIVATVHPSLRNQIARAIDLHDAVSVNHRVAGFLASAFDITFAALRQWHPGEKRQLQHLEQFRDRLPRNFSQNILDVLHSSAPDRLNELLPAVDQVVADIHQLAQHNTLGE